MARNKNELGSSKSDYVASAAKAALGSVPFVGSLLIELAGTVIPNQRIDRIADFAANLEDRIERVERERVQAELKNEEFTDLVEEGLRQAARAVSSSRREQIASVIANSLTSEDISYVESKHLLRLLGEINDIEIVWLRFFLAPTMGGDKEFRDRHAEVLEPVAASLASDQPEIDRETLQESYKEHLRRLGLLKPHYRTDRKTKMPEFDQFGGGLKVVGYEITALGQLLLREAGVAADESAG